MYCNNEAQTGIIMKEMDKEERKTEVIINKAEMYKKNVSTNRHNSLNDEK